MTEAETTVLTLTEFRKLYKISKYLATKLLRDPSFPAVRLGDKRVLIPRDRLEAWIAQQPTVGESLAGQA